jgi:hypothetical protein
MAKDEKQKEKHATNQFFRSLLGCCKQRLPQKSSQRGYTWHFGSWFSVTFQKQVFLERLESPVLEPQNQSLGRLVTRGILERPQAVV